MASARHLRIAAELLATIEVPLDRLPYSDYFEPVFEQFALKLGNPCTRNECWWSLLDARKQGLGPRRRRRCRKSRKEGN